MQSLIHPFCSYMNHKVLNNTLVIPRYSLDLSGKAFIRLDTYVSILRGEIAQERSQLNLNAFISSAPQSQVSRFKMAEGCVHKFGALKVMFLYVIVDAQAI